MKPVQLLGAIDILAAVSLLLLNWDIRFIPYVFLVLFLAKSILFFTNIVSIIDIVAGIVFVLAAMGTMYNIITWITILWIAQKGILSIIAS